MSTKKKSRGTTIKVSGPDTGAIMARLMSDVWKPIETAPNEKSILVAYDSGDVRFIHATDNDYEWIAWDGKRQLGIEKPMLWHPIPAHPLADKLKADRERAASAAASI